jgi:hypothetical protein
MNIVDVAGVLTMNNGIYGVRFISENGDCYDLDCESLTKEGVTEEELQRLSQMKTLPLIHSNGKVEWATKDELEFKRTFKEVTGTYAISFAASLVKRRCQGNMGLWGDFFTESLSFHDMVSERNYEVYGNLMDRYTLAMFRRVTGRIFVDVYEDRHLGIDRYTWGFSVDIIDKLKTQEVQKLLTHGKYAGIIRACSLQPVYHDLINLLQSVDSHMFRVRLSDIKALERVLFPLFWSFGDDVPQPLRGYYSLSVN